MAKKNYSYCKNGDSIVYADTVIDDGNMIFVNPTKEQYANSGWYFIVNEYPECPEGKVAVENEHSAWEWNDDEKTVIVTYRFEDETEQPDVISSSRKARVFSKLKCWSALTELGYWEQVKTWLESNGLWDAFLLAQYVTEDHPQFIQGLAAIKSALGLTNEQAESILAKCVED